MSTSVQLGATTYSIPAVGGAAWGASLTLFLVDIATKCVQTKGGTYTLLADVNFGANYGLASVYYKSLGTVSTTGIVRLANTESIGWRNAANSADKLLTVNASDKLAFDGGTGVSGVELGYVSGVTSAIQTQMDLKAPLASPTFTGTVTAAQIIDSGLTASTVPYADASKQLTSSAVTPTELGYVSGVTSAIQTQMNLKAPAASPTFTGTVVLPSAQALTSPVLTTPSIVTSATIKAAGELRLNNAGDTFYTGLKGGNAAANKIWTLPLVDGAPSQVLKTDGSATLSWGEASGGGVRNYISNASFEDTTITGWSTYADAAATTPVNGTAGSATSTVAYSAVTPLRQVGSMLWTKPASNRQGEGVSYDFTIDLQDAGKPVTISFDASMSSGYTGSSSTENLTVYVYDVTNSTLITPAAINIAPGVSAFQAFFIASTSVSYRLIIHAATTGTVAYTGRFDNFYIGPQSVVQGAAVTDPIAYVPATLTGFGNGTTALSWWRVGAKMRISGVLSVGISLPTTSIKFSLPTGYTADYTSIPKGISGGDQYQHVGTAHAYTPEYSTAHVLRDATSTTLFYMNGFGATYATGIDWGPNAGATALANGDSISVEMEVPIVGWSSSVTMANRSIEEYGSNSTAWGTTNTTAYQYGNVGSAITGTVGTEFQQDIQTQTSWQSTDDIVLQFRQSATAPWITQSSWRDSSTGYTCPQYNANSGATASFGAGIQWVSANIFRVAFGRYVNVENGTGRLWTSGWYWRVRKVSGGASVGYPIGARNVVGDTTGTVVPAGYIGETIEASITTATSTTSEADVPGASLPLTPGKWEITYSVTATVNTGATASNNSTLNVAITDSANTHVGRSERQLSVKTVAAVSNSMDASLSASAIVNISAATTYKLRCKRSDGAGTGTAFVYVSAGNYDSIFYAKRIG